MQCFITAKTTVKPHLKSLDTTLHNKNHITKSCKEGEFQCESDGVCIVGYKVCNNYNDCSDRSDENFCDFDTGAYDVGKAFHILHFIIHNLHVCGYTLIIFVQSTNMASLLNQNRLYSKFWLNQGQMVWLNQN